MADGDSVDPVVPDGAVPGRNGKGYLIPWRKGQSGNPAGQPSRRELLAREYADRVGLRGLLDLAREFDRQRGAVAKALLETATDSSHKAQIPAQTLLWRLLGMADRKVELEAKGQLAVEVRKLRIVDDENAPDGAQTIELRRSGNGKYEAKPDGDQDQT